MFIIFINIKINVIKFDVLDFDVCKGIILKGKKMFIFGRETEMKMIN